VKHAIELLQKHRRDHIATANALERKMGEMLDPNTEAAIDRIRQHRLLAEELQRAIVTLNSSTATNIEDAG
jgi:hypothetical protein